MNEPDIAHEPMPIREIHAIRLMIQDETKDMTIEEEIAYIHERAVRAMESVKVKNGVLKE
jgi:hypothetical protein